MNRNRGVKPLLQRKRPTAPGKNFPLPRGSKGPIMAASPGSTANVIAALASFFIPGLGQLLQGKLFRALTMFIFAGVLWFFMLGWVVHLWSIIDAAVYRQPA